MGPAEVQRCWPWLSQLLKPSVEGGRSLEEVRTLLVGGGLGLATVHFPHAAAVMVFEPRFDDPPRLWIAYLAGEIEGPPKVWLRTVRSVVRHFEEQARKAGLKEIRIGGRDWSRVFPDWLPLPAVKNGLRKVL